MFHTNPKLPGCFPTTRSSGMSARMQPTTALTLMTTALRRRRDREWLRTRPSWRRSKRTKRRTPGCLRFAASSGCASRTEFGKNGGWRRSMRSSWRQAHIPPLMFPKSEVSSIGARRKRGSSTAYTTRTRIDTQSDMPER